MRVGRTADFRLSGGLAGHATRWNDGTLDIFVGDRFEPMIFLSLSGREASKLAELFRDGLLEEMQEDLKRGADRGAA